jgi:hypothetical protein
MKGSGEGGTCGGHPQMPIRATAAPQAGRLRTLHMSCAHAPHTQSRCGARTGQKDSRPCSAAPPQGRPRACTGAQTRWVWSARRLRQRTAAGAARPGTPRAGSSARGLRGARSPARGSCAPPDHGARRPSAPFPHTATQGGSGSGGVGGGGRCGGGGGQTGEQGGVWGCGGEQKGSRLKRGQEGGGNRVTGGERRRRLAHTHLERNWHAAVPGPCAQRLQQRCLLRNAEAALLGHVRQLLKVRREIPADVCQRNQGLRGGHRGRRGVLGARRRSVRRD